MARMSQEEIRKAFQYGGLAAVADGFDDGETLIPTNNVSAAEYRARRYVAQVMRSHTEMPDEVTATVAELRHASEVIATLAARLALIDLEG